MYAEPNLLHLRCCLTIPRLDIIPHQYPTLDDPPRNPHNNTAVWNVLNDNRIRPDNNFTADGYGAQNPCACTDVYIIPNYGNVRMLLATANGYPLSDNAIPTNPGASMDNTANAPVRKSCPSPNLYGRRNG